MAFCVNCGNNLPLGANFCPECGAYSSSEQPIIQENSGKKCPVCGEESPEDIFYCLSCGYQFPDPPRSPQYEDFNAVAKKVQRMTGTWRNKWVSLVLCIFFGWLGIHRFYEKKLFTGIIYLCTFGLFGIGCIVDIVRLILKPNPYRIK
jgi:ribosomal protein L37AE/L43A